MVSKIKMLIMDVDGTLTDGKIYYGESGEELKVFNIKDGLGIVKAQKCGIIPVIITGRRSHIVDRRARELFVTEIHQGVSNKADLVRDIFERYGLMGTDVAYIGDDENDIDVMQKCGVIGCPKDAVKKVLDIADYVADHNGGDGAVRDFIEWIMDARVNPL